MGNLLQAAIFGAVQGLTEFLPVSSSGHLLVLHTITHFNINDERTFDVALHIGTLLALLIYFWRDILVYLTAVMSWLRTRPAVATLEQRLGWYLIIGSVPGVIAGAILDSASESASSVHVVGWAMIAGGAALWAADRFIRRQEGLERLGWLRVLGIGFGQALALIPGVSRSGATMTVARVSGLSRQAAARFSFLLAIPITGGAALKKMLDLSGTSVTWHQQSEMIVGAAVAALVGAFVIKYLLAFVTKHSYAVFAVYRAVVGAAILLFL
jgi:undecaprenyl-diphosphatase